MARQKTVREKDKQSRQRERVLSRRDRKTRQETGKEERNPTG